MTSPEMLESGRAEPDYDMQDDMSEFAVEYATELAQLDRAAALKNAGVV